MKAYRFRLQQVMHWYEANVSMEEQKLRQLVQQMEHARLRLQLIEDQAKAARKDVLQYTDLHGVDLATLSAYQDGVDVEKVRLQIQRQDLHGKILHQRAELLKSKQKLESLQRLKQRQFDRWSEDQSKEEEALALESFLATFPSC